VGGVRCGRRPTSPEAVAARPLRSSASTSNNSRRHADRRKGRQRRPRYPSQA
jgi:hypothetical protein